MRYRGIGSLSPAAHAIRPEAGPLSRLIRLAVLHVLGIDLALRALDFFVGDLLHHYMDTGMLLGIKARTEGRPLDEASARSDPPRWSPWRPRSDPVPEKAPVRPRPATVVAIKIFHTLAWVSIESCVVYVLYAGFAGRTDKRVGIAGSVVAAETLVFAGNGFRCPLTELAERYGAESGSVTDIYLPKWFAHNMPAIHTPSSCLWRIYMRATFGARRLQTLIFQRSSGTRLRMARQVLLNLGECGSRSLTVSRGEEHLSGADYRAPVRDPGQGHRPTTASGRPSGDRRH